MGLRHKVDEIKTPGADVAVDSGHDGHRVRLTTLGVELSLTPDEARRLGRTLLQHAARVTLSLRQGLSAELIAGRNLTHGPGGSTVDTDGSTG